MSDYLSKKLKTLKKILKINVNKIVLIQQLLEFLFFYKKCNLDAFSKDINSIIEKLIYEKNNLSTIKKKLNSLISILIEKKYDLKNKKTSTSFYDNIINIVLVSDDTAHEKTLNLIKKINFINIKIYEDVLSFFNLLNEQKITPDIFISTEIFYSSKIKGLELIKKINSKNTLSYLICNNEHVSNELLEHFENKIISNVFNNVSLSDIMILILRDYYKKHFSNVTILLWTENLEVIKSFINAKKIEDFTLFIALKAKDVLFYFRNYSIDSFFCDHAKFDKNVIFDIKCEYQNVLLNYFISENYISNFFEINLFDKIFIQPPLNEVILNHIIFVKRKKAENLVPLPHFFKLQQCIFCDLLCFDAKKEFPLIFGYIEISNYENIFTKHQIDQLLIKFEQIFWENFSLLPIIVYLNEGKFSFTIKSFSKEPIIDSLNRTLKTLEEIAISTFVINISMHAGVALYPLDGGFFNEIQNKANEALLKAKKENKLIAFYSKEITEVFKYNIIYLGDDLFLKKYFFKYFSKNIFDYYQFNNEENLLEFLTKKEKTFLFNTALIIDNDLSYINAFKIFENLKKLTPILISSYILDSNLTDEFKIQAYKENFVECFQKPINVEVLKEKINTIMQIKK